MVAGEVLAQLVQQEAVLADILAGRETPASGVLDGVLVVSLQVFVAAL